MSPIFIGAQSSSDYVGHRVPLLSGEQGTAQTIDLMRALVDEALADPAFVRRAIEIVRNVSAFDDLGEAKALYDWVKRTIRYTKDPLTKEKLYPPQELLKIRAGDCDDIAMLLGALALAIGYPARLITIAASASAPREFSHVYLEAEVPAGSGQWIPMDAARADAQFGIAPPMYFRKRAWSLTDDSYTDMSGAARCGVHGLGHYARVPGIGQDPSQGGSGDGSSGWTDLLTQAVAEVPQIITSAQGRSDPYAAAAPILEAAGGANPYASFQTPYTPGYGLTPAGYKAPLATAPASWLAQNWIWLALGAAVFMSGSFSRGRR